ncbi:DUF3576 domain-containing protein [Candidatus Pelagibacter sp.]|jgi:hypothetical protein|nr:DUF3576 domain-containing protein [Candidatus Pelagibacter sp.]
MYLKKLLITNLLLLSFLTFSGCGGFLKPDWSETAEPNARKRARQNVEEGRGISGGGLFNNKSSGNFTFASSNPLWRASLDTLDFMVLSTVDYAGGLIISDWYSKNNQNESIKITIRFLDNEVRVDAFDVIIHKKTCTSQGCVTNKIDSDLSIEIKDKILKQAAYYVKIDKDKVLEKNKNKPKMSEKDIY